MTAERFRIRAIPHRIRGATGRPGRDGADPGTALTGAELIVAPVRHARSGPGVDDAPESDASARLLGEEGWQAVQRVGIGVTRFSRKKVRVAPVSPSPLPSLMPPVAFAFFASFACLGGGFCAAGKVGVSTRFPYQSTAFIESKSALAALAALRTCGRVGGQAK